jgi:uncharacterized protein YbjT (DUF2867 family)
LVLTPERLSAQGGYMLKKVLVTGATGKIGSQLVPRLAAYNNIEVRALVRDAEKAASLEESADGLDSLRGQVSHLESGRHRP